MNQDLVNFLSWAASLVAIVSFVVSLAVLAWSAYSWVTIKKSEEAEKRYTRFFQLMDQLGERGSVASKMAAAFELKKYPEYAPVIIRLCEEVMVDGDSAEMLQKEMKMTAKYLRQLTGIE